MEPFTAIATAILTTVGSTAATKAGGGIFTAWAQKKTTSEQLAAYLKRVTNLSSYFVTYRLARQHVRDAYVEPRIIDSAVTRTHVAPEDFLASSQINTTLHDDRFERTFPVEQLRPTRTVELKYVSIDELSDANGDCLVLGDGGDGKSSLLSYLCWRRLHAPNPRLPVFVDSRQLRESTLRQRIEESVQEAGLPNKSLAALSIAVSVYVDGLDELPVEKYRETAAAINTLNAEAPDFQFTVACRSGAYKGDFEHMREVSIAPFSSTQADLFVRRWYAEVTDEPNADELLGQIHASDRLVELATKPLLLALMCSAFRRYLNISRRPTALFNQCIEALIWEWDAKKLVKRQGSFASLDLEKQVWLHSLLAAKLHDGRFRYCNKAIPIALLVSDLPRFGIEPHNADAVLSELVSHHSIFVKWTEDTYGFSHLAIQEYLTARWYRSDRRWEALLDPKRIEDTWWQYVIAFCLASMDDATEALNRLYNIDSVDEVRRTQIAAHCLRYDPIVDAALRNEIIHKILLWYHNRDHSYRQLAVEMLVGMEDEWTSPVIRRSLAGALTSSEINSILRKRQQR